jgi:hypothetical protein
MIAKQAGLRSMAKIWGSVRRRGFSMNSVPLEFDCDFYRKRHQDLRTHSEAGLKEHYERFGRGEGRIASPIAVRSDFVRFIANFVPALEIGPFNKPALKGEGVEYFDVLDRDDLCLRAESIDEDAGNVPDIDYVSSVGDLTIIEKVFKVIFSSHSIEHQPDLISHLCAIEKLLDLDGVYALIIPDCRYCFDHFINPSSIADVLQARHEGRLLHSLKSVIEHRALTTHNDPARHWLGDSGSSEVSTDRVRAAVEEWSSQPGGYIDVHAWQFTPATFRSLITLLHDTGYIKLRAYRVFDTPFGSNEFCALLRF